MSPSDELEGLLGGVDQAFRKRIVKTYIALRNAYFAGHYDAAGLRGGVFAETVIRFVQGQLTGSSVPFGESLSNFAGLCRKLEQSAKTSGPEPLRVLIPRALLFIYTIRNKRGIGHAGGDVEANQIDAAACVRLADWVLCELIRLFHTVSLEEAQAALNAISVHQIPEIWSVAGKRRVLEAGLTYGDQVLLLLYGSGMEVTLTEDLVDWTDHKSSYHFRKRILEKLHKERLVEWDREADSVVLSPLGVARAETLLSNRKISR